MIFCFPKGKTLCFRTPPGNGVGERERERNGDKERKREREIVLASLLLARSKVAMRKGALCWLGSGKTKPEREREK